MSSRAARCRGGRRGSTTRDAASRRRAPSEVRASGPRPSATCRCQGRAMYLIKGCTNGSIVRIEHRRVPKNAIKSVVIVARGDGLWGTKEVTHATTAKASTRVLQLTHRTSVLCGVCSLSMAGLGVGIQEFRFMFHVRDWLLRVSIQSPSQSRHIQSSTQPVRQKSRERTPGSLT